MPGIRDTDVEAAAVAVAESTGEHELFEVALVGHDPVVNPKHQFVDRVGHPAAPLFVQVREFFDGVTVDRRHARQVSALLPAALRGLYAERTFGSHLNVDDALEGLREAITLYMTPSPARRQS